MKQDGNYEGNPTKALPPIIEGWLPMSRGSPAKAPLEAERCLAKAGVSIEVNILKITKIGD